MGVFQRLSRRWSAVSVVESSIAFQVDFSYDNIFIDNV